MMPDHGIEGKLQVDVKCHVRKMTEECPCPIKPSKHPWNDRLFKVDDDSPAAIQKNQETFHSTATQGMFLAKRGRPDEELVFSFFSSRVQCSA